MTTDTDLAALARLLADMQRHIETLSAEPQHAVSPYDCEFCAIVSRRNQMFADALTKVKEERDAAVARLDGAEEYVDGLGVPREAKPGSPYTLLGRIAVLVDERDAARAELESLKAKKSDDAMQWLCDENARLEQDNSKLRAELEQVKREREDLRTLLTEAQANLDALCARVKELEDGQKLIERTDAMHRNCPWDAVGSAWLARALVDACVGEGAPVVARWAHLEEETKARLMRAVQAVRERVAQDAATFCGGRQDVA